jgi:arginine utilization regulatory protein
VAGLSEEAKEKLLCYDYPGNVRELENIIMAAISLSDGDGILTKQHILINNEDIDAGKGPCDFSVASMDMYLENYEKEMISFALAKCERNISKSAELLGIRRQTLQHKIKKFNL